jgi:hypothetical protein
MVGALALNDKRDPVGAPDFTLPVSILAQIIESLKVDIVAQSIPKLQINIASITSGVVFNVAQSGAWTINAAQSGSWTINAIESGTWTVNVSGTVNVNITNASLNVNVTNSTLTVTVSGTANVNVTNSSITVTGNVNITNTSLNVNVTNSSLTVTVSGTVNVNITNSSLTVTISGTPTINIQTSSGANIIVDKLTQSAYTEIRRWITNEGTTATDLTSNNTNRRGKFFPRGCRGEIVYVMVYARNPDSSARLFTVYIAPKAGMGAVYSNSFIVPASSAFDWRFVPFYKFWNYDSLFIWVRCENDSYPILAYDTGSPNDSYNSTDEITWYEYAGRYWFRLSIIGQTIGDIPISGTVNTIEIPATSSKGEYNLTSIPAYGEQVITIVGSGTLLHAVFYFATSSPLNVIYPRIYADGNLVLPRDTTIASWYWTHKDCREGIQLGIYDATNVAYSLVVTMPIKFTRELKIGYYNNSSSTQSAYVAFTYTRQV